MTEKIFASQNDNVAQKKGPIQASTNMKSTLISSCLTANEEDDMDRFWRNVQGDRTEIQVSAEHTAMPLSNHPDHSRTANGGKRRTRREQQEWDDRPVRQLMSPIHLSGNDPQGQLHTLLREATNQQQARTNPLFAARSGIGHYLRFCERIGEEDDVAPDISTMTTRLAMWMQDAPQQYVFGGKLKKRISSSTITQYLSHIDTWWAYTTEQPKCMLSKQADIIAQRREVTASARSAQRQVHGFTAKVLKRMNRKAASFPAEARDMIRSAHTLAWFAMLRPTEYMTTPQHLQFDCTKHMRARDIQLFENDTELHATSTRTATHMVINVKQSKTDHQRMGAGLTLGATTTDPDICPVRSMQTYLRARNPPKEGPLYLGLTYRTMLKTTRKLIKHHPELYGLHSFRVGGAQAMAIAGRSFAYIMAKGRWKHIESVIRYVETPLHISTGDSELMTRAQRTTPGHSTPQVWGEAHSNTEMGRPRASGVLRRGR
jgi:hypothetical protein